MQGFLQYNGKKACGYCLHPGVPIKNQSNTATTYRYVRRDEEEMPRTHKSIISTVKKVTQGNTIDGIKELSCFIGLSYFDLVHGFSIDYMHCIVIGIMPYLLRLWLDSKNSKQFYYINKRKQRILNQRIKCIKPTSSITRKPRSLDDKEHFKANEFRSMLLFYLRYSLAGLLDMKYVNHFQLLSAATYKLLRKKITLEDKKEAEKMLIQFADDFTGEKM